MNRAQREANKSLTKFQIAWANRIKISRGRDT